MKSLHLAGKTKVDKEINYQPVILQDILAKHCFSEGTETVQK